MLRVLHEFGEDADRQSLLEEATRLREEPGCVSAELYATLAAEETELALTMLWETEAAYDAFWARALPGGYPALVGPVTGTSDEDETALTEFYRRSIFALREGVWVPEDSDESTRTIFWPAAGPVRIIVQSAVQAAEAMYDRIRAEIAEARREEGCLEYAWYENVDLPGHLLLLELWADQVIYDRHWHLRGATAAYVGDTLRVPVEPQRGPVASEFYRWQDFRHHYDRWLPAHPAAYATTVSWPAS